MKYVIEIPTIEALASLTATAHRKAQAWMLDKVSCEVETLAAIGEEDFTLEIGDCPYKVDQFDVAEVANTLREMGYMTTYHPRKSKMLVEWSESACYALQKMKNDGTAWRFVTRAEWQKSQEEFCQKYGWVPGRK